ncbi:MAG: multicopper oxidase domain-containing protein [Alphaproteobacteria bacterium]|nr:multicopper oxidase domain-containing protein [Alphaproteobacteria bacterium]
MTDFPLAGTRFDATAPLNFDSFGCNTYKVDSLPTPDRLEPDVRFVRGVRFGLELPTPDGKTIEVWRFEDELAPRPVWPSPPIRVRQGQLVHTQIYARNNAHTIHHHGIEPTTFNDGVGHVSFEVSDTYDYQWRPHTPGTFFYHCHKNTVLHFEMGMYGLLIVDPPSGPGTIYEGGPSYQVEAMWVADDLDPRWRTLGHSAGMCGEDVGLNRFDPKYFCISGVFAPNTLNDPRVMVRAQRGQTVLIRLLNASYSILRTTLPMDAQVVALDGHYLGGPEKPWCAPYTIRANTPFEMVSAQRMDLLIRPRLPGVFTAKLEFLDWVTRAIQNGGQGVAQTQIVVT